MAVGSFGHVMLAGAVGGSAIVCGVATGPLLATAFDLAAAAATAGIAAHAVRSNARERGESSALALRRAARAAVKRSGAPLAAHALDVACRARAGDARFLRAGAMLLGRATSAHAPGLALQALGSWCAPLGALSKLSAPFAVARGARESVDFVRAVRTAAATPSSTSLYELEPTEADETNEEWEVAA